MDFATFQTSTFGESSLSAGLVGLLLDTVGRSPDSHAVLFEETCYTYQQLERRARAIAFQLNRIGVSRGDKVGLLFPNGAEFVAVFLAVCGLGATVVPVNPLLKSEEIAHILFDSQAKCLVVHARALAEATAAVKVVPAIESVVVYNLESDLPADGRVAFMQLTELSEPPSAMAWPVAVDAGKDLAVLVYTSGTTGKPKGAMLTHDNLLFAVGAAAKAFHIGSSDSLLAVLPLCHIYGLTVVMLGTIFGGGRLVVMEKFEAKAALKTIEKHAVTVLPAVPTMYQFMLMELELENYDLSQLRACISGAASLPVEIFAKIEKNFGAPLIEGYGLTEVSCVASFNRLNGVRKVGSVGLPFDQVGVEVFDGDGRHLPRGREYVGEIAIKGPNVMLGYYRQPDATSESIKDGWFFTGDLAYKDEDGYLFIVGRKKELIIRGGQNIYPREIEEVIARLESVVEVAVIGVPDCLMGERVKAVVVKRAGSHLEAEAVKAHCADHLAEYKVPRLVEFIDLLPRNSSGKILKRLLS